MAHWSHVKVRVLRQKVRIKWPQVGDENSRYFHASIKSNVATKSMQRLVTEGGEVVETHELIKEQVLSFYHDLLGTSTSSIKGVDITL